MIGFLTDLFSYVHLKRLARQRDPKKCFQDFAAKFPNSSAQKIKAVYKKIQELMLVSSFPVALEDRLLEDLEIDQGELDDLIEEFQNLKKVPITSFDLALVMLLQMEK